ncbi:unnamed protein product [Caenorhabditis sp. 36 PRJEB53466]|nr:unnamed protein product [Caenorhabditis sp. 36 PRJEB53466]
MPNNFTNFSKWTQLSSSIASVGFFSTSLSAFIFIVLSVYYVRTSYESYKRYMIVFSLLGFGLASVEFAVNPIFHHYNCGIVMFSLVHPLGASINVTFDLLLIHAGFYSATISFLTVQFFYRYIAILHPGLVPKLFGAWRIIIWICYAAFFGVEWAVGMAYFGKMDSFATEYMREEVQVYYGKDIEQIAKCAVVAYADNKLRWRNIMCILNMTFIMIIQYAAIIFFGWRMNVEMRKVVFNLSPVLWKLHTQFFRVLLLQILVPTLTLFMPVFILMYTPLLDLKIRFPSGVLLNAFSFFPAMDAIIVMFILSDYKNFIKRVIGNAAITWLGAVRISENLAATRTTRVVFAAV